MKQKNRWNILSIAIEYYGVHFEFGVLFILFFHTNWLSFQWINGGFEDFFGLVVVSNQFFLCKKTFLIDFPFKNIKISKKYKFIVLIV